MKIRSYLFKTGMY